MTEYEFEKLKQRVSELEYEVEVLKKTVANNAAEAPASVFYEKEMPTTIFAVCKKIVGVDSEGVKHQNGMVRYIINGQGYISITEDDLSDDLWIEFEKNTKLPITYTDDILHPSICVNGVTLKMFGHIDNAKKWKKVKNEETGRMDFVCEDMQNVNVNLAKEPVSFEKALGGKWMGIFASILIFVGFILFGVSIYAVLSEVMKSVILLIISTGFTVVGIYKLEREGGVLWNIVSGCGVGGSFITFILMNLVFHIINDYVLIGLLVLWIASTIFLAKKFSPIFFYVCYVGIVISTVLCQLNWSESIISFVFYLAATVALIISNYEPVYRKNYFWSIQFPVIFFYFCTAYKGYDIKSVFLWIILFAIVVAQTFIYRFEKEADYIVYTFANVLPAIGCFFYLRENMTVTGLVGRNTVLTVLLALSIVAFTVLVSVRFSEKAICKNVLFFFAAATVPFLNYHIMFDKYIGLALFLIPAILIGVLAAKKKYLGIGCAYLAIYFFVNVTDIDMKIVFTVSVIALVILLYGCAVKEIDWLRYYILVFITVGNLYLCEGKDWYNAGLLFLIYGVICFCINNDLFIKGDRATELLVKLYSVVIYLMGCGFTAYYDSDLIINENVIYESRNWYILAICLMTLALCVLVQRYSYWNSITNESVVSGIMTATGYIIIVLSIAHRLEAANYVVSLILILMAIIFIAVGFKIDLKAIRLYGLILSIICTIKLVFFDITYDSSIYYPIGLFVCGGLCLFICWIYNKIEKKAAD